jgi:hypothetical protein
MELNCASEFLCFIVTCTWLRLLIAVGGYRGYYIYLRFFDSKLRYKYRGVVNQRC